MQHQSAIHQSRANNFILVGHIDKKFRNVARRSSQRRIAGAHDANAFEQTHPAIRLEAKIRDVRRGSFFENIDQRVINIVWQLEHGPGLPIRRDIV